MSPPFGGIGLLIWGRERELWIGFAAVSGDACEMAGRVVCWRMRFDSAFSPFFCHDHVDF